MEGRVQESGEREEEGEQQLWVITQGQERNEMVRSDVAWNSGL